MRVRKLFLLLLSLLLFFFLSFFLSFFLFLYVTKNFSDGNKDTIMLENVSCINFEKRVQISKIIQDIMLYQSVGYNFVEVSEIQAYFARFSPLNSEKLYARSLIIEPRTK